MIPSHQLISLTNVRGVGPRRIRTIFRQFPTLEDTSHLSILDLKRIKGITHDIVHDILSEYNIESNSIQTTLFTDLSEVEKK